MAKYGGGKLILESEEEFFLRKNDEEVWILGSGPAQFVLEKDGIRYYGVDGQRIKASFTIPFKTNLFRDFEYTVLLQFLGNTHVNVFFERGDLFKVYKWLSSKFGAQFRLKEIQFFDYDLLKMRDQWPWNRDFLMFKFKHNPEETLSFVKAHLPELITIMSLRKIPRRFNEPFKFLIFETSPNRFKRVVSLLPEGPEIVTKSSL